MGAYEELVDAHAGVDGNAPAEVALELLLLHRLGRIVRQKLRQTLTKKNPHKIETKTHHESAAKTATTHTTGHKSERGRRGTPPPPPALTLMPISPPTDAASGGGGGGGDRERGRGLFRVFVLGPPPLRFHFPFSGRSGLRLGWVEPV